MVGGRRAATHPGTGVALRKQGVDGSGIDEGGSALHATSISRTPDGARDGGRSVVRCGAGANVWLVVMALLATTAMTVSARCTDNQRLELFDAGWTKSRVDEFCNRDRNPSSALPSSDSSDGSRRGPSQAFTAATRCATPGGECALRGRAVRGDACTCLTSSGAVYGIAQ